MSDESCLLEVVFEKDIELNYEEEKLQILTDDDLNN